MSPMKPVALCGLSVLALALTACGGGGGAYVSGIPAPPVNPTPTPTPSPTPTPTPTPTSPQQATAAPAIMRGGIASQEFASKGATLSEVSFPKYDGPLTGSADVLRIRYDASSNKYEVLEPQTSTWRALTPSQGTTPIGLEWRTGETTPYTGLYPQRAPDSLPEDLANSYSYSALAIWFNGQTGRLGTVAFGLASQASAIPISGSASYNGFIAGDSTETWDWGSWGRGLASVEGNIKLTFDFGLGSLSGSVSPQIYVDSRYDLAPINFANTVYAAGGTTFSGRFDTSLPGANSFSGLFTGPQAQELIGNFVFPYTSALDGKPYEAGGGFIARKP